MTNVPGTNSSFAPHCLHGKRFWPSMDGSFAGDGVVCVLIQNRNNHRDTEAERGKGEGAIRIRSRITIRTKEEEQEKEQDWAAALWLVRLRTSEFRLPSSGFLFWDL